MRDELLLVVGVKVSGHCLGEDWAHLLGVYFRSTLKLEPLVSFHVSCLALESVRLVLRKSDSCGASTAFPNLLKHFIVLSKSFLLFLGEILFVTRLSFKWKRVERILRMLLMENVTLSIFPIWKSFRICALSNNGFSLCVSLPHKFFLRLNFEILICIVTGGSRVHFMRIDNFRFFFQIECFSLLDYDCVPELFLEIFLVA